MFLQEQLLMLKLVDKGEYDNFVGSDNESLTDCLLFLFLLAERKDQIIIQQIHQLHHLHQQK